jgi:hypothetical protein
MSRFRPPLWGCPCGSQCPQWLQFVRISSLHSARFHHEPHCVTSLTDRESAPWNHMRLIGAVRVRPSTMTTLEAASKAFFSALCFENTSWEGPLGRGTIFDGDDLLITIFDNDLLTTIFDNTRSAPRGSGHFHGLRRQFGPAGWTTESSPALPTRRG